MIFAAPFMLFGLAALALPIAIHLLDRTRQVVIDWPSLHLLQIAHTQSAQRMRLKHLLVLAARLLLLALLVLAMARPYRLREQWASDDDLPTTLLIVLDNSFSMAYHEPGAAQSRFERAKAIALRQLDNLAIDDEVALMLAHDKPVMLTDRPTRDHEHVRALLREAELSSQSSDFSPVLPAAANLVGLDAGGDDATVGDNADADRATPAPTPTPTRNAFRHIMLITDLQRTAWSRLLKSDPTAAMTDAIPAHLTIIDIGEADSTNRYVRRLHVSQTAGGDKLNFEAEIGRTGGGAGGRTAQVALWLDGQQAAASQISGIMRNVQLSAPSPAPGTHLGYIELEADRLTPDDRYYFVIHVAGQSRLTIVSGDRSQLPRENETYFLEVALGLGEGTAVQLDRRTPAELSAAAIDHRGGLVLANVARLDGVALSHVENFLRRGGSVFICLGDRVDIEHYNRDWKFLPAPLERKVGDPARRRAFGVLIDRADHPVFEGRLDLSALRCFAMIAANTTTLTDSTDILASFSNGLPALLEAPFPAADDERTTGGRVILWTSSIDDDWSNLPYRRVFVPLIDQLTTYMTRQRLAARNLPLHTPVDFTGPNTLHGRAITVTAPDESRQTLTAAVDRQTDLAAALYRGTDQVGHYQVEADPRFRNAQAFAVNLDTQESLLNRADAAALREAFADHPVRIIHRPTAALAAWPESAENLLDEQRIEYWPWLLLLAFAVFVAESLLANHFTRRRAAAAPAATQYLTNRRTDAAIGRQRVV